MRYFILATFLLQFCISCYSQNIIGNPNFKTNHKKAIHRPAGKKLKGFPPGWKILSEEVRIDYFNDEHSTFHGFPIIKSLEPGGKIGFPFYHREQKLAAIQTKLLHPLVKGKKYEVSLIISQCVYSKYAIDRIPFIVSKEAITLNDIKTRDDIIVNVLNLEKDIGYSQKWVKVRIVFNASGGEEYFTLMSTRERFSEATETVDVQGCEGSSTLDKYFDEVGYYFIDAIEVIETKEPYKGECASLLNTENPKDAQLREKVEMLKKKKIIHPTSPTSFEKMKGYTHHIILFDVSGSMATNINRAKTTFDNIYASVGDSDLVSAMVFTHFSRILFSRSRKSPTLVKRVNELEASGGTVLESGLMLVNNNIVADENTKIYLITDVGNNQVSKKLDQYISIQLQKTKQHFNYFEYNYINNNTNKPFYNVSNVYDANSVFRVHNMSRKDARNFQSELNSTESYMINNISQCKFSDVDTTQNKIAITYNTRNYVFLVDASSSMRIEGKMDQLKRSIVKFTSELSHSDVSSLITYSGNPQLIVDRISNYEIDTLANELKKVNPFGGTGAGKAISYAYDLYGGKGHSHQNVTILMFTDGVFKVTGSIESTVEKNKNVHFKVYQFGSTKNPRLQKLETQKLIEYEIVKMEEIDTYLAKTKEEYEETTSPYSKAKWMKKATKFL